MKNYLDLLHEIITKGQDSGDRTGTGTRRIFSARLEYDLREGFPAVTHKYLNFPSVVSELIWFMQGNTNERDLCELHHGTRDESKKTIWTGNRDKQAAALGYTGGELGPVYGHQWRNLKVDQLVDVVNQIQNNPESRRIIIDSWNVDQLHEMALPPCHMFAQFFVEDDFLDVQVYMRSWDYILGAPYNIASYAALLELIALYTGKMARRLVMLSGDTHVYQNHLEAAREMCWLPTFELPYLNINNLPDPETQSFHEWVSTLAPADLELWGYKHGPRVSLPMSA